MSATEGRFVCKECLSKNKSIQSLLDKRCVNKERHDSTQKEFVKWNGTKLVPARRSFPQMSKEFVEKVGGIAMCNNSKRCKLERCTYAHNKNELMRFNKSLLTLRKGNYINFEV